MAASNWRLEGQWMKNCNCAFGCPCDFNAPPTHGSCTGMVGMKITKGHFEGTKLDDLMFAATVDFPGALHEGNGKMPEHFTWEQCTAPTVLVVAALLFIGGVMRERHSFAGPN